MNENAHAASFGIVPTGHGLPCSRKKYRQDIIGRGKIKRSEGIEKVRDCPFRNSILCMIITGYIHSVRTVNLYSQENHGSIPKLFLPHLDKQSQVDGGNSCTYDRSRVS